MNKRLVEIITKTIVKKLLREAKTAQYGRFKNLERILSMNYYNLKPADQNLKDQLFRAYYRYFNSGEVNAFGAKELKKINAPADAVAILTNATARANVRLDLRYSYGDKKSRDVEKYEKAMEDAILATFKYFKSKYPDFFNTEGRQKMIQQWKGWDIR